MIKLTPDGLCNLKKKIDTDKFDGNSNFLSMNLSLKENEY